MFARPYTRLLLSFATVAVALTLALAGANIAGAQETTGESEVLTRYDSEQTAALQEEYDALKEEEKTFLEENEYASYTLDDEKANQLVDSRLRDIEDGDGPVEGSKKDQAAALRRQAASLYSLQNFADDAGIDVNSEVYSDGAELIADEKRDEAEELEAEAEEEAAEEEAASKQPETTTGAAAGNGGEGAAENQPEPKPEAPPEEVPAEPAGTGFLPDVNLIPIVAFIGLIGTAILALSRAGGMSVRGFFSPAMASVRTSRPRPQRPSPKPKPQTATTTTPNLEDKPETKAEPETKSEDQRTKKPMPLAGQDPDEMPEGSFDSEELQRWLEMPSPKPEKPDEDDEGGDDDEEPPD